MSNTGGGLLSAVEEKAQQAQERGGFQCVKCGQVPFFFEADKAMVKGHCYSEMGVREVAISGCCEYCFDEIFLMDDLDGDEWDG